MDEGDSAHSCFWLISFLFMELEATLWQSSWNLSCTRDSLFVVRKLNSKLNDRNREKSELGKADESERRREGRRLGKMPKRLLEAGIPAPMDDFPKAKQSPLSIQEGKTSGDLQSLAWGGGTGRKRKTTLNPGVAHPREVPQNRITYQ